MNDILNFSDIEVSTYRQYRPIQLIRENAVEFVQNYSVCNGNSVHIRRTDFRMLLNKENSDERFMKTISESNLSFFLTSDNVETRSKYIDRFGHSKLLTFGHFSSHLLHQLRRTNLALALTEALIAAHSREFHLTYESSWSEYIDLLHRTCQIDRCCEHLEEEYCLRAASSHLWPHVFS